MCLYSFVIPVYNVKPEFLKCCVDSILGNAFEEMEIILVDDKSDNGCEVLCDQYQALDQRIKVIHQPHNMGVSKARNTGIEHCAGDWVIFVDSDDWIETNLCRTLGEYTSSDADVIIFSMYRDSVGRTQAHGTTDKVISYSLSDSDHPISELQENVVKLGRKLTHPEFRTLPLCWGKAFRRQFLEDSALAFPDELKYFEDIIFMNSVFQKAETVIQIPDHLYHFRPTQGSATNSFRKNALSEQKQFLTLLQDFLKDDTNETLYYGAFQSMQRCILRYFYHKENKKNPISRYRETKSFFSEWPFSEVFYHVKCRELQKDQKIKALLIKFRLYFWYYFGSELKKKLFVVRFK